MQDKQDQEERRDKKANKKSSPPEVISSPPWRTSTKRIVVSFLVVLALLGLFAIRAVIVPVIIAVIIAYVMLPVVDFVHKRTKMNRNAAIVVLYLLLITFLIAIPVSTLPQLIKQGNDLIDNTPAYIQELGQLLNEPLIVGEIRIPLDELPINDLYSVMSENMVTIVQTIGPQSLRLFGATVTTVGWILIIFVLAYYMVKDYQIFWNSLVALAPDSYHADIRQLGSETSSIWNAFLRGQLILGLIVGLAVSLTTFVIGLPNALFLGLLAGLLEFIPNIGPVLTAIPAVLFAFFQSETSWLGSLVGPFWFALIVLALYAIIQRVENVYLVPRIIGRSLNLHPLIVLIGAVIGASVAGVSGILLAAPLLATARLLLLYIYHKLLDQPPFKDEAGKIREIGGEENGYEG